MKEEEDYFALADITNELKAFADLKIEQMMINKIKGLQTELENVLKEKIKAKRENLLNSTETEKKIQSQQQLFEDQETVLTDRIREQIASQKEGLSQLANAEEMFKNHFNRTNSFYAQLESNLVGKHIERQMSQDRLDELKRNLKLLMNCTRSRISQSSTEVLIFDRDNCMEKLQLSTTISPKDMFLSVWQAKAKMTPKLTSLQNQ